MTHAWNNTAACPKKLRGLRQEKVTGLTRIDVWLQLLVASFRPKKHVQVDDLDVVQINTLTDA
ncbi:MAG: hypothetical protein NVS3B14_09790 [Ktedonobacteraceae bacterium]